MTTWNYIIGSEKDFEGAPDWASMIMEFDGQTIFEEHVTPLIGVSRFSIKGDNSVEVWSVDTIPGGTIIAQRELVTNVKDDRPERELRIGSGVAPGVHSNDVITERSSKYHREIKPGVWVDVYDVLVAFNVTCPALQHLIKKALAVGQRGHKDASEDLKDILASAKRAIELSESNK